MRHSLITQKSVFPPRKVSHEEHPDDDRTKEAGIGSGGCPVKDQHGERKARQDVMGGVRHRNARSLLFHEARVNAVWLRNCHLTVRITSGVTV